jgi:dsRNA-specific ribonuclease
MPSRHCRSGRKDAVLIKGKPPARGAGASKRQAEQAAATLMLSREGVWRQHEGDA